jgi:hypothetical protein
VKPSLNLTPNTLQQSKNDFTNCSRRLLGLSERLSSGQRGAAKLPSQNQYRYLVSKIHALLFADPLDAVMV